MCKEIYLINIEANMIINYMYISLLNEEEKENVFLPYPSSNLFLKCLQLISEIKGAKPRGGNYQPQLESSFKEYLKIRPR